MPNLGLGWVLKNPSVGMSANKGNRIDLTLFVGQSNRERILLNNGIRKKPPNNTVDSAYSGRLGTSLNRPQKPMARISSGTFVKKQALGLDLSCHFNQLVLISVDIISGVYCVYHLYMVSVKVGLTVFLYILFWLPGVVMMIMISLSTALPRLSFACQR